jgi:hypothetical protein
MGFLLVILMGVYRCSVLACIHVVHYAYLNIVYIIQVPCIITISLIDSYKSN